MRPILDEIVLTDFSVPDRVPDALAKSAWGPRQRIQSQRPLGACTETFVGDPFDPRSTRHCPAGPVRRRYPAGEFWNDSLLGFVCNTDLPDQPWKIARMNKITYALALGAGLVLSLASPNAQADPIVQTLTPTPMSASQFNSLYTPSTTVLTSNYDFMNTPNAGVVESQVFTGTGAAAGTYAYAYQFGVNSAMDTSIQQLTSVNSASMLFNATPVGTDFTHTGTTPTPTS